MGACITGTSCQLPELTNARRPPASQITHDKPKQATAANRAT